MLKAIAHADRERAVNVEESNDTSGYRTLSCVLMENTITEEHTYRVFNFWSDLTQHDALLASCAGTFTSSALMLLMQITFRRSAPMLNWKLDLSGIS